MSGISRTRRALLSVYAGMTPDAPPCEAIVLMGPPGAGKSHLGRRLREAGVALYQEMEPELRQRFGTGREFESRIAEVGAFLWSAYQDQLRAAWKVVAFESGGVADRALLEALQRRHRVALVHVDTPRDVCAQRVVERGPARNISHTTDPDPVRQHYDFWRAKILGSYEFALTVDGVDAEAALREIEACLGVASGWQTVG